MQLVFDIAGDFSPLSFYGFFSFLWEWLCHARHRRRQRYLCLGSHGIAGYCNTRRRHRFGIQDHRADSSFPKCLYWLHWYWPRTLSAAQYHHIASHLRNVIGRRLPACLGFSRRKTPFHQTSCANNDMSYLKFLLCDTNSQNQAHHVRGHQSRVMSWAHLRLKIVSPPS